MCFRESCGAELWIGSHCHGPEKTTLPIGVSLSDWFGGSWYNTIVNPELPQLLVLYEDADVVVIAKPAGMTVNRAETVREPTVQDWAEGQSWYKVWTEKQSFTEEAQEIYRQRSGLAHRLDKETSGCLLLAKHPLALMELLRQFRDRETQKKYLGLVHGKLSPADGIIRLPLGRSGGDRHRFGIDPEGKDSETEYHTLRRFAGPPSRLHPHDARSYQGFSLMELKPKTGRTHQLRVHLSHLRHPLVADSKYVGRKRLRLDGTWCARLFLHAAELGFEQPLTKQPVVVQAPLPADLSAALERLQATEER